MLFTDTFKIIKCDIQHTSLVVSPANAGDIETWVWSPGQEDPLEEGMASHSSILAWRIPWTEEPGGPQSIGSQRVRQDWSDWACVVSRLKRHSCRRCGGLSTQNMLLQASGSEAAQPCPTLCDPMDCSLPGSSVHGIFQARVLEGVAISFSRGSSQPRDRTRVSRVPGNALPSEPPGKPYV